MTKRDSTNEALEWLTKRGGDAVFDKNGVALAQGELAPFMRATWNKLRDAGKIEFYKPKGARGRGRLRVVPE